MLIKKFTLGILVILAFASCNNDDSSKKQLNGFTYDSNFYNLENAYYYISNPSFTQQDFFIILTNGNVESFSLASNNFVFSEGTTSAVVLNGRKFIDSPIPTNKIPTGLYYFDPEEANDEIINYNFNCTINPALNAFETCQNSVNLLNRTPSTALFKIEYSDKNKKYILSYDFRFSDNKKIEGNFEGLIDFGNQIL